VSRVTDITVIRSGSGEISDQRGTRLEPWNRWCDVFPREYSGIPYSVVQTANPNGRKWTIYVPGKRPKSGMALNRPSAIRLAETAIDKAIKVTIAKPRPKP
jgi:hypothetical protein